VNEVRYHCANRPCCRRRGDGMRLADAATDWIRHLAAEPLSRSAEGRLARPASPMIEL